MANADSSVATSFTTPEGTTPPATLGETITVHNNVTITLPPNVTTGDIVLTDELNGVIPGSDVTVEGGGTYYNGIITWDLGTQMSGSRGLVAYGDYQAQITVPEDYMGNDISSFAQVTPVPNDVDPSNNTSMASIQVVCFRAGTLIETPAGGVPVERLRAGDLVVTASGRERPIRWLGHRTVACRHHPRPHEVLPVRIAAHAFGEGQPARDLFVSPGHAICVDVLGEVLIPAGALVDGISIQQVEVDEVTYWHVELDSHDIILAEDLPAESYLDMGNRSFFAEADVVTLGASPDADASVGTRADFCRAYQDAGPLVDLVKARLHALRSTELQTCKFAGKAVSKFS